MIKFADFLSSDDDDVLLHVEDSFQCNSVLCGSLSLYLSVYISINGCASVCFSMVCLCGLAEESFTLSRT